MRLHVNTNNSTMPKSAKKSLCDLCSQPLAKGQDILNCEGGCSATIHRYCAGVTSSHFETLTKGSAAPFVCQWCALKNANAVIQQLQADVASLKSDLATLRAQTARKDTAEVASLKSELAAVNAQLSKRSAETTATATYAAAAAATHLRSHHNQLTASRGRQNPQPQRQKQKTSGTGKPKRNLVQVNGARKIWGTLKVCTPATISSAISKILPSGSKLKLTIKWKTKQLGLKSIWWFVVHGTEHDMTVLEKEWESTIKIQTPWTLKPCFMVGPLPNVDTGSSDESTHIGSTESNTTGSPVTIVSVDPESTVTNSESLTIPTHDNSSPLHSNSQNDSGKSDPFLEATARES